MSTTNNVGFIGGGNMATAIAVGIVNQGLINPSQVYVSGPRLLSLQSWKDRGMNISTSNLEVFKNADLIFLCVKPHILRESLVEIKTYFKNQDTVEIDYQNKIWISVLAGISLETLQEELSFYPYPRVIRTMPNTPMMVGAGCIVYTPGPGVTDTQLQKVETLLKAVGICESVPEKMISAVGAVSGCGPAFIYNVIEALSDGGVKMGVPRQTSTRFAAQMVLGAAKMVLETGKHPGLLKDEVCSAGGSTIAGVHELEKGGIRAAFMNAVEASAIKSEQLGKISK